MGWTERRDLPLCPVEAGGGVCGCDKVFGREKLAVSQAQLHTSSQEKRDVFLREREGENERGEKARVIVYY